MLCKSANTRASVRLYFLTTTLEISHLLDVLLKFKLKVLD